MWFSIFSHYVRKIAEILALDELARLMRSLVYPAPCGTKFAIVSRRPNMTRYKSFDIRSSILALCATVLMSTTSLLFAAGPIDLNKVDAPQSTSGEVTA
jgi:hypothetical protein